MLSHLAPARRRLVGAVAGLAGLGLLVAAAAVVLSRPETVRPVDQGAPGPVLLVPGYGGSESALDVLAAALRGAGREAEVVSLVGDGTGDLNEQVGALDRAVSEALARTGAGSVDLVGYSAGGITVRLWTRDAGGGAVARRVVTLGSPHHGTDVAALAAGLAGDSCPEGCRQLATDSDLLRELNADDETPAGPRWVSIWTTDDQTVVPASSGSLDGALDFSVQSVCPAAAVSHGDLPRDPTVIAMTLRQLGTAAPRLPGPEVCTG